MLPEFMTCVMSDTVQKGVPIVCIYRRSIGRWLTVIVAFLLVLSMGGNPAYAQPSTSGPGPQPISKANNLSMDNPKVQEAWQLIQKALSLQQAGKYQEALDYSRRGLQILEPLVSPDDPMMGQIRFMLEVLPKLQKAGDLSQSLEALRQAGQLPEAMERAKQGLGLLEQSVDDHSQLQFRMRFTRLMLLMAEGDMPAARPLLEQTIREMEQQAGPKKLDASGIRPLLAFLHSAQGDVDTARRELEKALKGIEKSVGKNHPLYGVLLTGLGAMQQVQGEAEEAEKTLRQAQQFKGAKDGGILEALSEVMIGAFLCEKEYGKNSYGKICQNEEGRKHIANAMEIGEKVLSSIDPNIAQTLRERKANHYTDGGPMQWRSFVEQAYNYTARLFGTEHPFLIDYLGMLARIDWEAGNLELARQRFQQAGKIAQTHTQNTLPALAFAEQRAFLTNQLPQHVSQLLSISREGQALQDAYALFFRWKGLLVEYLRQHSLVSKRLILDPKHRPLVTRLQILRQDIAGWYHQAEQIPHDVWQRKNDELTYQKENLERELARAFPHQFEDPIQHIGLHDFQALLNPDEAFVDVYRYTFWEPEQTQNKRYEEDRYAAVIVIPKLAPVLVDLGLADKLEQAGQRWRTKVISQKENQQVWQQLADQLWRKVAAALPANVQKVWLSPDDELARLPWHLFPDVHRRTQSMLVSQIDSARELARLRRQPPKSSQTPRLLLIGAVDFNAGLLKPGVVKAKKQYLPLAETSREIEQIKHIGRYQQLNVNIFKADLAHKDVVISHLSLATYAHLATHGFFAQRLIAQPPTDQSAGQPQPVSLTVKNIRNPLVESGLALAGANIRDPSDTAVTGLLTAEEFVGLDLRKTLLVTLSACDTGRGEEVTGQGVMGLRSSVMAAGARSLLMSMWKVPDEATRLLMQQFYTYLWRDKRTKIEALKLAQEDTRREPKFAKPRYWAAWVLAGEGW